MTVTTTLYPKKCSACGHCQAACPKTILEIQRISVREKDIAKKVKLVYHPFHESGT